jgi:hypothetical protein
MKNCKMTEQEEKEFRNRRKMKELTIQEKKIQRAIACLRMTESVQEAMHLGVDDNIDSSQWKIAERRYKRERKLNV